MIKRPLKSPRPTGRAPKINPGTRPDWYKRFRQLAALADKTFRLK
jgi:hypothetical protein